VLDDDDPSIKRRLVTIDPKDLIGRTFLKDTEENGQSFRARVVRAITDKEKEVQKNPEYMKFICELPESNVDEITYNEILDHLERDNQEVENDTEQVYKFHRLTAHQGPLRTSDKDYKGSTYNVLVEWETEEATYKPLDLIANDDPVTCFEYARTMVYWTHQDGSASNVMLRIRPRWNAWLIRPSFGVTVEIHFGNSDFFWKFGFLRHGHTHKQSRSIKRSGTRCGKKQRQWR
jgi:hypothetical protein